MIRWSAYDDMRIIIWVWWWCHLARIISLQKIFGLHGHKPHIVEKSGDVTDAGQPTEQGKIELLSDGSWKAEFRNSLQHFFPHWKLIGYISSSIHYSAWLPPSPADFTLHLFSLLLFPKISSPPPSQLTLPGPVLPNSKREAVPGNDRVCHTPLLTPSSLTGHSHRHHHTVHQRCQYKCNNNHTNNNSRGFQVSIRMLVIFFTTHDRQDLNKDDKGTCECSEKIGTLHCGRAYSG